VNATVRTALLKLKPEIHQSAIDKHFQKSRQAGTDICKNLLSKFKN
jgi:hypothetical protein